jgi:hypothetical protein
MSVSHDFCNHLAERQEQQQLCSSSSGSSCNGSVDSENRTDEMLHHSSNSFMYANNDIAANEEAIVQPRPEDVLLGRGTKHQRHPGNNRYTGTNAQTVNVPLRDQCVTLSHVVSMFNVELIRSHRDAYFDSEDSLEKKLMVCRIVDAIVERGGRFLKRVHANTWIVVPKDVARTKAAHAIQYRQRRKSLQLSSQTAASPPPPPPTVVGMNDAPPPDSLLAEFSNHHAEPMAVDAIRNRQRDANDCADIPTWISTFGDSTIWEPIEFQPTDATAHQRETLQSTSVHSNVGTAKSPSFALHQCATAHQQDTLTSTSVLSNVGTAKNTCSAVHQHATAHALDVCSEIEPLEPCPSLCATTDQFTIALPCACKQVHAASRGGANSPSPNRLVRTTSIGSFDAHEMYDKSHGDIKW